MYCMCKWSCSIDCIAIFCCWMAQDCRLHFSCQHCNIWASDSWCLITLNCICTPHFTELMEMYGNPATLRYWDNTCTLPATWCISTAPSHLCKDLIRWGLMETHSYLELHFFISWYCSCEDFNSKLKDFSALMSSTTWKWHVPFWYVLALWRSSASKQSLES